MAEKPVRSIRRLLAKKLRGKRKPARKDGSPAGTSDFFSKANPMWKTKIASTEEVLSKIEPGMSIFLGTGMAEPRTLVKHLMESAQYNLQDLELIQLVSLGYTIAIDERY